MHRSTARTLFCACVLAVSLAGLIFPCSVMAAGPDTPSTSPTTGKLDVTFNITLRTSLPSSAVIGCEVTATVSGDEGTFREVFATAGTRSGSTATCDVWFYYSWLLLHPASDTINLTYEVGVPPEGTGTPTLPYRDSVQSGSITPVPANGTITRITVDTTL